MQRNTKQREAIKDFFCTSDGPRYERSGAAHHHHFLCNRCERIYNIEGCLGGIETLLPRGFQMESHDLLLTGLCAKCGSDR